jgi:hypothetical protein
MRKMRSGRKSDSILFFDDVDPYHPIMVALVFKVTENIMTAYCRPAILQDTPHYIQHDSS